MGPGPQPAQQPPSPARRSMFDFVSPFDALQGSSSSQAKRKPIPQSQASTSHTSISTSITSMTSLDEPTWSLPPIDPKRKSVENLMDQITRGQVSVSPPHHPPVSLNDPYTPSDEPLPPPEPVQPAQRAPRPLPPQPQVTGSPRSSPPKVPTQQRQQRRGASDSPAGQPADYSNGSQKEKEYSPLLSTYNRRKGRASPMYVVPVCPSTGIDIDQFLLIVSKCNPWSSMLAVSWTRCKHLEKLLNRQLSLWCE